jgi:DNA-directed RNA polymerase subunit F
MFLMGSFAEDISMFRQRNHKYNLKIVVEEMMKTNFDKALLQSYLKGRTLQCAAQLVEILPRDYEDLHKSILEMSIQILQEEKLVSVKLVATKCLIKFARKLKPEVSTPIVQGNFE